MDIIKANYLLYNLYNKNSLDIQKKIINTLISKPSNVDGLGWIYGFYSKKDKQLKTDYWIKIGRTERNPFHRVENEWGGTMMYCISTTYNYRLERLIHLFLDYSRETRYGICNVNKKYHYIKKNNNELIIENKISEVSIDIKEISSCYSILFKKIKHFFKKLFCCKNNNINNINNNHETYQMYKSNINTDVIINVYDKPFEFLENKQIINENEIEIKKEIEWFHFTDNENVPTIISEIWKLVENQYDSVLLINQNVKCEEVINIININIADINQLMSLPNIGKVLAQKIIDYRTNKTFNSIEDIKKVHKNIKYDKLKKRITV
jgi:predicted nucleic acid-binding OB-fold protein